MKPRAAETAVGKRVAFQAEAAAAKERINELEGDLARAKASTRNSPMWPATSEFLISIGHDSTAANGCSNEIRLPLWAAHQRAGLGVADEIFRLGVPPQLPPKQHGDVAQMA